uniref:Zinc finger (CCCH type), RNA-binding motif and serine/arginine rich 2 n=1 Tax=Echeneis naucrates TaxID=173247 RepID=A0A665VUB1_ECHNA
TKLILNSSLKSHFSQKKRRAAQRKERRKRKRQALAQTRERGTEKHRQLRLHEEWLDRERIAQEEFRLRSEREEAARRRKEEEERMIKEEWEAQQRKQQEEKEQKQQEKRDREVNRLDNGGPWMNPEAPVKEKSENFGTECSIANCPFFLKTGACRFGDRCSRKHIYPTTSPTLMIRGMFTTYGMEQSRRDDYDIDASLEHSEEELQETFLDFYHDVLPEFKSVGRVLQFKVSCNYEPHLRGNVYIQFETEEQCKEALIKFNGRWYAGRQLHCELCPVTRWKNAVCGLFDRQKCPKGKHCNFLHVFRNPGNEFWEADRDLHMSPDRRDGWHSERYRDRSWRQYHCSRSPPRSERSHSRREDSRRRSRSQERRVSHQDKDDKWSSRSRHSNRRKDRYPSRSRVREHDRLRNRSRDEDREDKYRSRSEERNKDESTHRERSRSKERKRHKESKERSPKNPDRSKKTASDERKTRRHKHSKKSKNKSKKKHKKRSHLHEGSTSSEESEEEMENLSATTPSGKKSETEPLLKNSDEVLTKGESEQSNTEISEPAENGDKSST